MKMKSLLKLSSSKRQKQKNGANKKSLQDGKSLEVTKPHPTKEGGSVMTMVLGGGSFSAVHGHGGTTTISSLFHLPTKAPRSMSDISSSTDATTSSSLSCSHNHNSKAAQRFLRHSSSFLRVADLNLAAEHTTTPALSCSASTVALDDSMSVDSFGFGDTAMSLTEGNSGSNSSNNHAANFSYAAVDPPPGMDHDPLERWVALDDGSGSHAPIAPVAVQALVQAGLDAALNEGMWTQHSSSRCFKAAPWHVSTWPSGCDATETGATIPNTQIPAPGAKHEDQVLLWMGKFQHGLYGSELPAVRAVGVIPAAPKDLFDMLIDSDRVKEYNNLSLGRQDLLVLQDNLHNDHQEQAGPFGKSSVTKVMLSKSKPPLLPQAMQFVSLLHAQELDDGSGYLIVTRAVTHPDDDRSDTSVLRSEILLGVNVIRRIEGDPDRCVMINMIHLRSPMVPMIIANRIGASAAGNFIKDLRLAFC